MNIVTITDSASGATARIAAHIGFNCFEFRAVVDGREVDVIDSKPDFPQTQERPSGNGSPILFPFPNRIEHGRFTWEGHDYLVPLRPGTPHAIHGFAYDRPWRVTSQSEDRVTGEFQISRDDPGRAACWPADGLIEVTYRVRGATLRMDVRIANPGDRPLPWGFGTHTYFKLPLAGTSDPARCLVQAPAREQWVLNDQIPTGERTAVLPAADLREGRRYGELKLDHVLTGLEPTGRSLDCVVMDEQAGLEVIQQCDPAFRELVAFTPPWTTAVCLEPYTCVTNAINLQQRGIDAGLQVLPPGGEARTWIQITARPILA
jgi:aldose 1-epimerase